MNESKTTKAYHLYSEEKETYGDIVKQWRKMKKDMKDSTGEDREMRWSYSNGMFRYFDNAGKEITDNNPYVNIVDLEEFDLSILNHPMPVDPPAFNNKNRLNFFGSLMDEYSDNAEWQKKHLTESFERIMKEAKGKDLPPVAEKKETDLVKLKSEIIDYAKSLGFVSIGVTKIDRRFVSVEVDDDLIYDTMIIMGYEMPYDIVHNYPNPKHDTPAYYGYSHCARYVHDVADFIRAKGHDCRARSWEGFIKYSVHAVNAGMGNFSTFGICRGLIVSQCINACPAGIEERVQAVEENAELLNEWGVKDLEFADEITVTLAFEISENFDTPVLFRMTTRVCHSKSIVECSISRSPSSNGWGFLS
jgi:hypothetical protein